jgi:predicted metal-dependent hydrolase
VREFKDGEVIDLGDRLYTVSIAENDQAASTVRLRGRTIFLTISSRLSPEDKKRAVHKLVTRLLAAERRAKLQLKLKELNRLHFNARFKDVAWHTQTAKWGSCTADGRIFVSSRLLFAPEDVLEYVCIHELAHLIEFNHSKRFWKLVGQAMPDYGEKITWLRAHGMELD